MNIGAKIALCRKEAGMSQEALAAELGISRQAVSRWETGEAVPDTGKVIELSRIFSVTTDYLLLDEFQKKNVEVISENENHAPNSVSIKRTVFRIILLLALLAGGGYLVYYALRESTFFRGWIFSLGAILFFCGVYGVIVEYLRED